MGEPKDDVWTGTHREPTTLTFALPEQSNWQCFMFGNRPGGMGMVYRPAKGRVPNAFVRFMMRVCFDCVWVKDRG